MTLNLIADRIDNGKIYPALTQTSGQNFDQHYPYTVPLRLQEYCVEHRVPLTIYSIEEQLPANSFYPIGVGFFDFTIDYIELLPPLVRNRLHLGDFKLLFYYHEGDNPVDIKQQLDRLCSQHELSHDSYVFVSGNTAAKSLPNFVYFADFELWYYQRNRIMPALKIHRDPRERDFTVLSRLHKSWRALAMTDLKYNGILDNAYWSYCETGKFVDEECAIRIDDFSGLRTRTEKFLQSAPYISDELDHDQRNDHGTLVPEYHVNSYCNIVMETHFDICGSGTFLTEKTFKPIKHGQMFFVAGPAGSLQMLRDLGYRVFDSVLDNSYDQVSDATQRWKSLIRSIYFAGLDLPQLFELCRADIEHNQQLFLANKAGRLNTLIKEINAHY